MSFLSKRIEDMTSFEVILVLRHRYLSDAKFMLFNSWSPQDDAVGEIFCQVAEGLQSVIDVYRSTGFVEAFSYQEEVR